MAAGATVEELLNVGIPRLRPEVRREMSPALALLP